MVCHVFQKADFEQAKQFNFPSGSIIEGLKILLMDCVQVIPVGLFYFYTITIGVII